MVSGDPFDTRLRHGTPEFRRTALALFSAGFATFALLYCVQPIMPVFARQFHVSAAESSLALSLTSGVLAPAMIVAGAVSEARGRKSIMVTSLLASAMIGLISGLAPSWHAYLAMRAIEGVTFAGLPAVAMAYLSEEVHPGSIGLAMGLAIGGNGLGGMIGRLLTAFLTDLTSWRWAVSSIGIIGLVATTIFWRALAPSRHFVPRSLHPGALLRAYADQFRDPRLVALFCEGFILMGAFVTTYNYATYRLMAPPYSLRESTVGLIFLTYIGGVFASAWIGSLADRVGRGRMLALMFVLMLAGVALTLCAPLALVVAGIAVVTFGFFGGHSVASSWVGLAARGAKAQASALYLLFYYVGASVAGTIGGVFWDRGGWPGVAGYVAALVALGLAITTSISANASRLAHG
ncbi:MAG TPA: MFS transporter [Gemmatimonadaceae bacterium]|nr:MFS transporter [Gemmatimonadaceae bacterium]